MTNQRQVQNITNVGQDFLSDPLTSPRICWASAKQLRIYGINPLKRLLNLDCRCLCYQPSTKVFDLILVIKQYNLHRMTKELLL